MAMVRTARGGVLQSWALVLAVVSPACSDGELWDRTVDRVPSEYPTIQAAVDAADDGDVVVVARGRYEGRGDRDIMVRGKGLAILSEDGAEATTIDCGGAHFGFTFQPLGGSPVFLKGFTIQHAVFIEPTYNGAAVACWEGTVTITSCRMRWKAVGHGAGRNSINSTATLEDCTFANNWGKMSGAGVYCAGSTVTIRNCRLLRNTAVGGGTAVFCHARRRCGCRGLRHQRERGGKRRRGRSRRI